MAASRFGDQGEASDCCLLFSAVLNHDLLSLHVDGYCLEDVGGCQNYCPFLGTLHISCHIIIGFQKWTIILTTTHVPVSLMPSCNTTVCVACHGTVPSLSYRESRTCTARILEC